MLEETGYVVAQDADYVWVSVQRRTACESCAVQKGCGTSVLSKIVGKKIATIRVANTLNVKVGDKVRIGIDDNAIVSGSILIYLVPLLMMLLFSVLASIAFVQESLTVIAALAGLLGGFLFIKWYTTRRHIQRVFQAQMLSLGNHQELHFSAKLLS